MYESLFNDQLQSNMEAFFLNHLSTLGHIRHFKKGEIVDPKNANHIYIVMYGAFNQVLYSRNGDEITYFRLYKGTIFGEMDFFEGARTCIITKAMDTGAVSVVPRQLVEKELAKRPEIYNYFLHSIIRKYRIVMLELADVKFNDAMGKIAHALIRWYYIGGYRRKANPQTSHTLDLIFTHEEIATRTATNRSTVTNALNYFKEQGYIKIENKQITLLDIEALKKCTTFYWLDDKNCK